MSAPTKNQVPVNPDNVYFDLLITNIYSEKTAPIPIYFNENRTNPIINNSGDYEMSIVRFSVDTLSLPVFSPIIQPNQSDPDLTTYSVTMSYLPIGATQPFVVQQYVEWSPQNADASVPPAPSQTGTGLQSSSGAYYFALNYQWWILLIYEAFQTCFATLQANVLAGGYTDIQNVLPPLITWNTDNSTAVISAESQYFNNNSTFSPTPTPNPQAIQIYFNSPLYALFSSFPAIGQGYQATLGRNYRISIGDFTGSNQIYLPSIVPQGGTQYLCTQVFQEYSTIANWTPVSSVVFVSNTLPIVSNQLSAPLIYNEANVVTALNGNNANFAQIITDIETNENCYKPNLIYNPSAQYRYISMTGNSPLTNVDVSVFWKSKLGQLNPLLLPSGSSCTLKFLFSKRGMNTK